MAYAPFTREREIYKQTGRRRFAGVEAAVPWSFIGLYAILILATLIQTVAS